MNNAMVELTDANFSQVVESQSLVFIEFWAQWCVPCKNFRKIVEKVSVDYPSVTFASVDIEQEVSLKEEFEVRSIPAIMVLRDQCVVAMETGAMTDEQLRELLTQAQTLTITNGTEAE